MTTPSTSTKKMRNDEEYDPNPQKVIYTYTNSLGLGSMYTDRRITINVGGNKKEKEWMQCWAGEKDGNNNDEWWFGAPSVDHRFTSFTALIPTNKTHQETARNVWKTFKDNHFFFFVSG